MLFKLAQFRYRLRLFLRFSERAARADGVTPQQHQLMLGVAGYTERGWATISDLAEFLQERHNAVVGLVERAAQRGLVTKRVIARDHRFVQVTLTVRGRRILGRLVRLHRRELARFQAGGTFPFDGPAARTNRQLAAKADVSSTRAAAPKILAASKKTMIGRSGKAGIRLGSQKKTGKPSPK